ncbi:MAG: SEL1-like repeat protein [Clostridia bacterium]|nr:SEL1-like repeat protein [Clostridia bacterium]
MNDLKLPQAWHDWHITEEIGEGAYGRVYRAEKDNGGVTAVSAIKVVQVPSEKTELLSLRREFRSEEELRRNLKEIVDGYVNEIRVMYRLQGHTHIVSIQDHLVEEMQDELGWRIYIRMEYLQPFDDYAMTHPFTREETIRLGISLCEALGICAGNGILHRDIKPENLFVTESGEFKLGDFGIAKVMDRTVSSYSSKGTFGYMAPEVFAGKPYDTRADLYSTGIILYKLMNKNRDPFIDTDKQIITYQDREQAMSLRMKGEKLPAPADADEDMAKVILMACEFEPKDRFDTPEAMLRALKELLQPQNTASEKPKKKRILPLCAAVILLIAGIAAVILFGVNHLLEQKGNEAAGIQAGSTQADSTEPAGADELYAQGVAYYNGNGVEQDSAKAADLFTQAADMGNADAQNQLGYLYLNGIGVSRDPAKAEELFFLSAEQGNVNAQFNLGLMYREGNGVEVNPAKSAEMFRLAAEQGDAESQNYLGLCHLYGDGVEQDYVKAREWFLRAAEQGFADAMNNLGRIYRSGYGVKQNDEEALYWYQQAAQNGNLYACYNLGYFYEDGIVVEQNYGIAAEYYQMAADGGIEGAREGYENCLKMMKAD